MSSVLFICSHASDDPTMATLPFELAAGAAQAGHEATVALLGEAVSLMRDEVADELRGFGCPPFRDVLAEVIGHEIPIYV